MNGYTRGYDLFKVAVLGIIGVIAFLGLFLYVTNRGLAVRRSDVYVRLPSAAGLRKGDPVVYRGVTVGEVRRLEFVEGGDVLVRAKLMERLPLTQTASAELVAVDLFGRQSMDLRDGAGSTVALQANDTIEGVVPKPVNATVAELGAKADRIVGDTTVMLMRDLLTNTALASRQLASMSATMERLIATQQEQLSRLTREAATVAENLRTITTPGPLLQTRDHVESAAERFAATTQRLDALLAQVEQGKGNLGLLLHDRALYERSEAVLASVEALVKDVKANPKRYIKVSVF